ncbi:SRPBCC family protein [Cellulomonas sp. PS-H5]|uniref:SRPBCC family protein n=1 Tax=Cellulomonas sp. PS-H5 TaxID=2820400 RepID=UPI001C4EA414|nr:SRPBCC family protein [Cellulomonas sp. PS-H5]MBW0255706.1 SRPBCC family protein [Cellulomonas sp. PS-H5]
MTGTDGTTGGTAGTDGTTGRAAGGGASPRTGGPAGAAAPAGVHDSLGALRLGGEASVTFRRRYPTDAADLWDAVTTPERLARWLGPVHGDLTPGGAYELRMGADEAGSDQNATGVVRSCDPPQSFAVEWCFPGERPSEVEVRVEPGAAGEGAVLVLVHTRLEDAQAIGYGAGWHTSLDQLADHLAGADVRDWDTRFRELLPTYRALAAR